jgi:hypothetical protein
MNETMTRSDRETLIKIARQRERVAKSEARERAAALLADFEQQMDRRYSYDENDVWEDANNIAKEAFQRANKQIAEECERLGIPSQFAPRLTMGWHGQWRNSVKEERTEMRRVASKQVDAALKSALAAVERVSVAAQEKIMVGGLSTDDARRYLESMPTAEALMPTLTLDRIEQLMIEGKPR